MHPKLAPKPPQYIWLLPYIPKTVYILLLLIISITAYSIGYSTRYIHDRQQWRTSAYEPPIPDDGLDRQWSIWEWETNDKGEWYFRKIGEIR